MIQTRSMLIVADNTGAKLVQCIRVVGSTRRRYASLGDLVTVVVKDAEPRRIVKKHEVVKAVIIRTRKSVKRNDGSYIRFDDNAVVIVDDKKEPKGGRISGPVAREVKEKGFDTVASQGSAILTQAASELDGQNLPQAAAGIPWFHNVVLIEKLKDPARRLWYARQAIANGWSRSMLLHWIESDLYARQGKAVTNFQAALPPPQSDLAAELVKDPYTFDFLTLRRGAAERDLERGLLDHIRKFLLELGAGFAFVGRQVHLEVGGEDFYIDLLFYHLHLRCYIVIDLKARPFKPEYAGKMNFYLSAVDDLLRHADDKPSIGLILCKTRNKVVAEYALRDVAKPVGIARYVTRLVESLPARFKGALPAPRDIEAELRKDE